MYIDQANSCDVADLIVDYLMEEADGTIMLLAAARHTAREIVEKMSDPPNNWLGYNVSVGYVSLFIRRLRESVMKLFFEKFPYTAMISNWRIVAEAVGVFTMENGVCWHPGRQDIINVQQKFSLLRRNQEVNAVRYNSHTHWLLWSENGRYRRTRIVSYVNLGLRQMVWENFSDMVCPNNRLAVAA